MKILIVSNLYPPLHKGGYELRCAQVAGALAAAGHRIVVLTSTYGLPLTRLGRARRVKRLVDDIRVHRCLYQHAYGRQPRGRPWTLFHALRRLRDAQRFVKLVERFEPDVVNWWSMNGLSKTLLPLPAKLGVPDIHWIEHPWMIEEYGPGGEVEAAFWQTFWAAKWAPWPLTPLLRVFLRALESHAVSHGLSTRRFPNDPAHVCFVSRYLRDLHRESGVHFVSSEVIHGGVSVDRFYRPLEERSRSSQVRLKLLYAGQVSRNRCLHTVLEALAKLSAKDLAAVRLTIAGDGPADYVGAQRQFVKDTGLEEYVRFAGWLPHEEMSPLYASHHVLVFPTARPEGLPLTMVEAMLAGCAVITTGAGGAREVAEMADLPLFPEQDSEALAQILASLAQDRERVELLAARGQEIALECFGFDRMMRRFENILGELVTRGISEDPASLVDSTSAV